VRCITVFALLLGILLSPCSQARPDAETLARVIAVIDGDTLLLMPLNSASAQQRFYKLRLADIDAPEMGQAFGEEAKRQLTSWVLHQTIRVVTVATDRYGRRIGWVRLAMPSPEDTDINTELVQQGLAWVSTRYQHPASLLTAQQDAQLAARGLWANNLAIPPWVWRKQHPATHVNRPFASTRLLSPLRD
jgi:micrococcal nuclease